MHDVVFMTALVTERCDPNKYIEQYSPYAIKSWKKWCEKNNHILFVFNQSHIDTDYMMPTWQRWNVHQILEDSGIVYNRILLVDADTMVHPDCPNIWDQAKGNYGGVIDDCTLEWIHHSIVGYQKFFPGDRLDWERYVNNGMIVLPESVISAKALCKEILDFYEKNREGLVWMEKNDYRGTDQTPVNFIAEDMFGDNKKFLSKKFNMNHMHKTDILYNSMHIDMGDIWHFNGIPTAKRNGVMEKCWNKVKDNYGGK